MTINDTDVAYDKKGGRKDRNLIKVSRLSQDKLQCPPPF